MRKKTTKNSFVACERQSFDRRKRERVEERFQFIFSDQTKSPLENFIFRQYRFFSFSHRLNLFSPSNDLNSRQSVSHRHMCVYTRLYHQFIPKYDLYKAGQVEAGGNSVEVLFDSVGSLVSMVGLSSLRCR